MGPLGGPLTLEGATIPELDTLVQFVGQLLMVMAEVSHALPLAGWQLGKVVCLCFSLLLGWI